MTVLDLEAPDLPPARLIALSGRGEMFARVAFRQAGEVPVLALHGWQATADLNFCSLYPALGQRGVVAPDARSHGRGPLSEEPFRLEDCADDAATLLDHLGIERAIVLGYSMGGAIAQLLADRRPDLASGLVIAGSALRFAHSVPRRIGITLGGWHGSAIRSSIGRWGGHRLVDRAVRTNDAVAPLRPWIVAELERGHPGGLRSAGRALAQFDGRPLAARAVERGIPSAVVLTTGDRLCPPRLQRELADALHAPVFEVAGDHDAPLAVAPEFVTAVLRAIEQITH